MTRIETRAINVTIPVEVLDRARERLHRQGDTVPEAIRRALAEVAEVNLDAYPVRPGRGWSSPEEARAASRLGVAARARKRAEGEAACA